MVALSLSLSLHSLSSSHSSALSLTHPLYLSLILCTLSLVRSLLLSLTLSPSSLTALSLSSFLSLQHPLTHPRSIFLFHSPHSLILSLSCSLIHTHTHTHTLSLSLSLSSSHTLSLWRLFLLAREGKERKGGLLSPSIPRLRKILSTRNLTLPCLLGNHVGREKRYDDQRVKRERRVFFRIETGMKQFDRIGRTKIIRV